MRILKIFAFCWLVSSYAGCEALTVSSGITLKNYRYNSNTSINVLTVDPSRIKMSVVRAQDVGSGLQTVADMAKHFSALAAINGGFFRIKDPGTSLLPAGVLKINNQWHGIAYKPRGAIGWDPESNLVLIDILQTESKLKINNRAMPINAINTILGMNRASLFSDSYVSSVNIKQNLALLINNQQVTRIFSEGEASVEPGSYIYYANGTLKALVGTVQVGDPVDVDIQIIPQLNKQTTGSWNKVPFVLGGGPLLISEGTKITDFSQEKMLDNFIHGKYARTAIGILANKQLVFVVTEYTIAPETFGLSIAELADFMQSLGCVSALNLDGGGSSAMYAVGQNLAPGRPVADALLVTSR